VRGRLERGEKEERNEQRDSSVLAMLEGGRRRVRSSIGSSASAILGDRWVDGDVKKCRWVFEGSTGKGKLRFEKWSRSMSQGMLKGQESLTGCIELVTHAIAPLKVQSERKQTQRQLIDSAFGPSTIPSLDVHARYARLLLWPI
jgi:hypothetical protein